MAISRRLFTRLLPFDVNIKQTTMYDETTRNGGKIASLAIYYSICMGGNIGTAAGRRRLLNFTGTRQNRCEIFTRNMYTEIRTRLKTNARLELD